MSNEMYFAGLTLDGEISLYEFNRYGDSLYRLNKSKLRHGQVLFNLLHKVRPDLSEKIRGTDNDPFHCENTSHPNWNRFHEFLAANW